MWQRFTERARRVIVTAQEEARGMNSSHVGTEHILLGLLRESEGVAAQVLKQAGLQLDEVRARIRAEFEYPSEPVVAEPRLSPKAKRVLELASDDGWWHLSDKPIDTEHLLIALAFDGSSGAGRILNGSGLDLERVREQVVNQRGAEEAARRILSKPHIAEERRADWETLNDSGFVQVLHWMLQEENAASKILANCGLDVAKARQEAVRFLEDGQE